MKVNFKKTYFRYGFAALWIVGALLSSSRTSAQDFWNEDIWQRDDRPFLFYGETKVERIDKSPTKIESIDTSKQHADQPLTHEDELFGMTELREIEDIEKLRAKVKSRLEVAVMKPSEKTIGLYLQANAFLMDKAGVFAQKWREHLIGMPQYDWTAQHPSVNAASIEIARHKRIQTENDLLAMKDDWGYVFLGDDSPMTHVMSGIAEAFSKNYGFEIVSISVTPANVYLPEARFDPDAARMLTGGVNQFPALVLVNRSDTSLKDARLIATGVVDAQELARRTAAFYPASRPDDYQRGWLRIGNVDSH